MKMTERTKKYLAVGAGAVVCIVLIAAISLQFGKAPSLESDVPEESSAVTEIIVDPSIDSKEKESENGSGVTLPPEKKTGQSAEEQAAVDSRPAQTDQPEQSIQPDVTKPEPPSEEVLHDPTMKPDGTKVDTPPEPVEHDAVEPPEELPTELDTPQAGETKGDQIYVPGFGWVENHGGGSSGIVADDMYENGNKIGIMD